MADDQNTGEQSVLTDTEKFGRNEDETKLGQMGEATKSGSKASSDKPI